MNEDAEVVVPLLLQRCAASADAPALRRLLAAALSGSARDADWEDPAVPRALGEALLCAWECDDGDEYAAQAHALFAAVAAFPEFTPAAARGACSLRVARGALARAAARGSQDEEGALAAVLRTAYEHGAGGRRAELRGLLGAALRAGGKLGGAEARAVASQLSVVLRVLARPLINRRTPTQLNCPSTNSPPKKRAREKKHESSSPK